MRPSAITLAVLVLSTGVAHASPVPDDHHCMGEWVGEGRNTGFDTSWTINLTLTGAPHGGRCGTIEYTRPTCGGTLENCRLVGDEIHTQERYTHTGDCAPPGRVIIRCDGSTLHYAWIGWERVDSTLHRPAGSGPARPRPSPDRTEPAPPPTPAPSPPAERPSSAEPPSRFGCTVGSVAPGGTWLVIFALAIGWRLRRRTIRP